MVLMLSPFVGRLMTSFISNLYPTLKIQDSREAIMQLKKNPSLHFLLGRVKPHNAPFRVQSTLTTGFTALLSIFSLHIQ